MIEYDGSKKVWFTSDLHFGHDKEFVWKARGFKSVQEMNEKLIENIKAMVKPEDDFWILGDFALGGADAYAFEHIWEMPGNIHFILGNHDTNQRERAYREILDTCNQYPPVSAERFSFQRPGERKFYFYASHFPTLTSNYEDDTKPLSAHLLNLHGHTHQKTNFFDNNPYMYHVGVDSHDCKPVEINQILDEIKAKYTKIQKEGVSYNGRYCLLGLDLANTKCGP